MALGSFACTGTVSDRAKSGQSSSGGSGSGQTGGTGTGTGNGGGPSIPVTLDSGRTVIRRLNLTEYNLTVRDLLGTSMTPGDNVPADSATDNFNTVGEALGMAEEQAEAFVGAASALSAELFALPATDPRRTKVFVCKLTTGAEATCARQILTAFARRAFRRPPATAEIDSLMAVIDKVRPGGTYNDGLQAAITVILLSPHFLYREETSMGVAANAAPKPLNAYELATRLSYFLWSSMPDDALSASADSGKLLSDPAELPAQIDRMLADPKAVTLSTNFGRQWLALSRLDPGISFVQSLFPTFDDDLRASAQEETATFFSHLISDNLPLNTLINADFTYANARLAKHYGLTNGAPTGTSLVRVSLDGTPRAGLLTQASFLMGNAHPNITAPVLRGKYILERLLCVILGPVPPGVNTMFNPGNTGTTARAVLEAHRADAGCAVCHNLLDPLGVGLENFDAIGAYRTMDNGAPVDAHGMYPGSGLAFSSAADLSKLIAQDSRYPTCVTKNLLTYGAGRLFDASDAMTYASAISQRAIAAGAANWKSWISVVASSDAFRTNRPDDPQK